MSDELGPVETNKLIVEKLRSAGWTVVVDTESCETLITQTNLDGGETSEVVIPIGEIEEFYGAIETALEAVNRHHSFLLSKRNK